MPEGLPTGVGLWLATAAVGLSTIVATVLSELLERSGLIRLRHWAEQAGPSLRTLYHRPSSFEAFRLVLSLSARLGLVALLPLTLQLTGRLSISVAVLVGVALVAEVSGRVLAARDPEEALNRLTPIYGAVHLLLKPLLFLARAFVPSDSLKRRVEEGEIDEASEGEIEAFIDVGQQEGILEPGEEELLKGIVEFGDTVVKSVMTPRTEVQSAPADTPLEELIELFMESGHSRIPLYMESTDQIVGVLHIRDLLEGLRTEEDLSAEELAMEPFVIPVTKPIADLLREFQARRQQLAVVVDEFGGAAGVVTVEDLLEEIVGEIADEHEQQDVERVSLADGVWQLAGSCEVDELEELFGVDLDEVQSETVGGLVFNSLGYLPDAGEKLVLRGLEFEVIEVSDRRIRTVRVERAAPSESPGAED
jgi:CBS domain containing-hemolysin-like protein